MYEERSFEHISLAFFRLLPFIMSQKKSGKCHTKWADVDSPEFKNSVTVSILILMIILGHARTRSPNQEIQVSTLMCLRDMLYIQFHIASMLL